MTKRKHLRAKIGTRRQSLTNEMQQISAQKLTQKLSKHRQVKQAEHIALFLANNGEIDTMHFINWCWNNNKKVYLPVIHPFTKGHLLFLHYHAESEMLSNQYGILEPKLNVKDIIPSHQLDIIFTPLVAFDHAGNRLGMGGGYYDRLLAPWFKNKTGGSPIGLAHDCQQVNQIPIEAWDIPLPEIITPTQHFLNK